METKQDEKEDFTKKRQQFTIGIRKQKREQIIQKKRRQTSTGNMTNVDEETQKISHIVDDRFAEQIKKFQRQKYEISVFPELIKAINDADILKQHYGAIGIRKIMSIIDQPPIQLIIDSGIIPRLIQLVSQDQYPQLQLQATWSLANVASGSPEQCSSIIHKDAIQIFVKLLKSKFPGIVQQAIWALGNIASDSTFNRDAIIRKGGIKNLIYAISMAKYAQLIQSGAWALSNLCRGTPLPNYEIIKQGVLFLAQLLPKIKFKDFSIFADCCWSISYNFPKNSDQYQKIVNRQLIFKLRQHIDSNDFAIIVPIIRIFGRITKINDSYVDLVFQIQDFVDCLYNLICFNKKVVRIQTCFIISNIMSGPQRHIDKILNNQNLVAKLLQLFQIDCQSIKKQICYIFINMITQGNKEVIYNFFKQINIMKFYVQALTSQDPKLIQDSLLCMYEILEFGQKFKSSNKNKQNPFVTSLTDLGALSIIEELQFHDQQNIYDSVVKIMKTFFQMEDNLGL